MKEINNSRGASQPKVSEESTEEFRLAEKGKEFDEHYRDVIINSRGTMFGMLMTIVDTLNLPGKQFMAIKSLIARDIDKVFFDILDRNLRDDLIKVLGHTRQEGKVVKPLA